MALADRTVGAGKDFRIHRIGIASVNHQPVAGLAALFSAPLAVGKTGRLQIQLYGNDELVGAFAVTLAVRHEEALG
ncbi:hypothetical protein D9M70_583170 [compost metagenome]